MESNSLQNNILTETDIVTPSKKMAEEHLYISMLNFNINVTHKIIITLRVVHLFGHTMHHVSLRMQDYNHEINNFLHAFVLNDLSANKQ